MRPGDLSSGQGHPDVAEHRTGWPRLQCGFKIVIMTKA
jgi:hypothetical protein